jgi:predicted TIM-barrel fold metal-dependent hydrolase
MNVEVRTTPATPGISQLAIADCDIHHSPRDFKMLYKYLEPRWREHIDLFGVRARQGNYSGPQYPKGQPDASRRDAWPLVGGQLGILAMIRPHPGGFQNLDLSGALCRAINDWQVAEWTAPEPRLKASIVVPYEDAAAAVAEIDRWAGHPDMVQVLLLSRTVEPLGNRRYWPIYEAAARAGLPIGIHAFGNGGQPTSSTGWASFYIEDMIGDSQSCQSVVGSMVTEGVFARFPTSRVVLIEAGFARLPSLAWRMDRVWSRTKAENPALTRLPSEYIHDHIWLTTQPMEEPQAPEHLRDVLGWLGMDRLLFATDYPHWDYDDPQQALKLRLSAVEREAFFIGNAQTLYTR